MNECMDQVPGHFNHQIVVMVLLSRINHGISAGYPCCWLPFLEQHYSLCDFFFFSRTREMHALMNVLSAACSDLCICYSLWNAFPTNIHIQSSPLLQIFAQIFSSQPGLACLPHFELQYSIHPPSLLHFSPQPFSHLTSCSFTYLSNVHLLSLQVKSINVETFVKCFMALTKNLE